MQITHEAQILILKTLLYNDSLKFSELNLLNYDNNHLNYHIKQLIQEELIKKVDNQYSLTPGGLNIANRIDSLESKLTHQPKSGIMVIPVDSSNNYLVGKRKKDIGRDMISFFTEKIRFGERFEDAIERCLTNETGLRGEYTFIGLLHFQYYSGEDLIEDTILSCFKIQNINGELIDESSESSNYWVTEEELYSIDSEMIEPVLKIIKSPSPIFLEKKMKS